MEAPDNNDELEYYADDDIPLFDLVEDEDKIESEVKASPEPPADEPVPLFEVKDEPLEEFSEFVADAQEQQDEKVPVFELTEDDEPMESIVQAEECSESEDLFELDYSDQLSVEKMDSPLFAHADKEAFASTSPTLFDVDSERDDPDKLKPLFDHSKFSKTEQGLFDLDHELPEHEYKPLFITEKDRRLSSGPTDLLDAAKNNGEEGWLRRKEEESRQRRLACELWRLPLYKNVRLSLKKYGGEFQGILLPVKEPVSLDPSQPLMLRIDSIEFSNTEIISCVRIDL